MEKVSGLRKRWLINNVFVIIALGLVCVLAITAVFAASFYSNMRSDLRSGERPHWISLKNT